MGLDIYFNHSGRQNEIGYFRKVNFLVSYFENRGYEINNCEPVEIDKEDILELKERCRLVYNNRVLAEELLPTCSGFFFGNQEYNDDYFEDVLNVQEYCDELLEYFDDLKSDEYITFDIWY